MRRFFQFLLIFSTVALSWMLMMIVHEAGHVLNAWLSGATVSKIELPPLAFSRTDLSANPHPLFVAWGGAAWGCLLPLLILGLHRMATGVRTYLTAWFAGFCLVANGAYLLGGSFIAGNAHDGGAILHNGGSLWALIAFGTIAVAAGLYCWNGLGRHFGLGDACGNVDRRDAIGVAIAAALVACVEIAVSCWQN